MMRLKFNQYSFRTYLVNTIANKFKSAQKLACGGEKIPNSTDSRSILIPLFLLAPTIYYFGGINGLEVYGRFLLINIISTHIAFAALVFIEMLLSDYSNFSQREIFQERIDFFKEYTLAWHFLDKTRFIRFGFFIIFLLASYLFMWYSIVLNKPIEYCLFKYVKFGLVLNDKDSTEVDSIEQKTKALDELKKNDLVKLKSDGRVDQWTDFAKKEIINIYLNIRKVSNSSDADCRRKATEQFGKKFKHVLAIAPNPNSLYKWLNY